MGAFRNAARKALRAFAGQQQPEWRPLGLHPNCTVQIDWTQILLAREANSCFPELPLDETYNIDGVGTLLTMNGAIRTDRYYLDDNKEGALVVEVESKPGLASADLPEFFSARLVSRLPVFHPRTEGEWDVWFQRNLGRVGLASLVMPEEFGHSSPYARLLAQGEPGRIEPITASEAYVGVDGSYTVERQFMLYGRDLPAPAGFMEYATIGSISSNGDAGIEVSVAIELPPGAITAR